MNDAQLEALEAERAKLNGAAPEEPFQFDLLTARELCALPDHSAEDELLGPLLRRGSRLVIGGATGSGKTTFSMQVLKAVVLGEALLDWTGPGEARALVVDAEQGLKTCKRVLHQAGLAEREDVDYVRVPDGLKLDSSEPQVEAVEQALEQGDYALVLCDPLYKLHSGDSNAEREAVDLMRRLDHWRERFQFGLVLPMHLRKRPVGAKFTLDEFFGSSAYLRGAEVVVGLDRLRDGYARLHLLKDRDGDLPVPEAWGLFFDREQGFRRDPEDGKPKQTAKDKVRELLEAQPGLVIQQLVKSTGNGERTVRDALRELGATAEAGLHNRKGWHLPEVGKEPDQEELGWS